MSEFKIVIERLGNEDFFQRLTSKEDETKPHVLTYLMTALQENCCITKKSYSHSKWPLIKIDNLRGMLNLTPTSGVRFTIHNSNVIATMIQIWVINLLFFIFADENIKFALRNELTNKLDIRAIIKSTVIKDDISLGIKPYQ